jgi:hypothetical protein
MSSDSSGHSLLSIARANRLRAAPSYTTDSLTETQAKCLDRIDALADKHRIDRDLARRMAAEEDHYDEAA